MEYEKSSTKGGEPAGAELERKRAEEQLKRSEENYRSIFNAANDAIFVLDLRTGAILAVNQKMSEMYGYTQEEALRVDIEEMSAGTPGYGQEEALALIKRASEGPPQLFEWMAKKKNGELFWVEVNLKRAVIGGDRLLAIVRDITDRKAFEQKLLESEERFRQLAENTSQVFWFMMPKPERVLYVSPAFESIWGVQAEDLYHNPRLWAHMIHSEDRDAVEKAFTKWAAGKAGGFDMEYRIVRPDGEIRWIRDRGTMVRDVHGRLVRLSGIADDITERKRIEQETEKTRAQLEEAQHIAGIGNWEWDRQTNRVTWSHEVYRIFGVRRGEFKETFDAFMGMVHPEDRPGIEEHVAEAVAQRKENSFNEYRIIRPDGDIRTIYTRSRFHYNSQGVLIALRGTTQDVTEARRTEAALKVTQFSVDHASVSVFFIGPDARFLYVNEQACRTLGYTREELLSMAVYDIDPRRPLSSWNDRWKQLKTERYLHFETVHRKKDGTLIPMQMSINYLSFGGREYNVAFGLDISERKRAENELIRSYNLTKTIIDSMNDAISLIDVRNFTIIRVNKVFLQKYGYTDEEIIGKHCYQITHHRSDVCSAPNDICPLIETVKTRDHYAVDHVHYDRRGEKVYVEVSTSPIKDEAGNVIQVVHVQRDITERKRAEEALRESENRFRAFFESAAVGTVQLDPMTGKFLRTNDEFCRITGYECDELRSMTFRDLTHPEDRAADAEKFMKMVRGDSPQYEAEKRYIRKDGQTVWVHVSATIVRDAQGRPVHTAGVVQDITARKKMEEEIMHMAHHDSLTGLPNRRLFRDIITLELAQAHRNKKKAALLFLDLDRFKEINDTLGHEAGDLLLREAAARLKTLLRKSDTISRIGGDEFNIILADIARPDDVSDIARKLIDGFRKPFLVAGHELHVTASIGISIYPDDSDEIDSLLRFSDMAMYHAKESGRNTFRFYDPSINIRSIERIRMENMLLRSLELGELVIYYQPQIDISTRRIVCAEALIRWRHPEKQLLLPKDFIPAAEETGFITAIDEFVLSSVCTQVRAWLDAGLPRLCVTVNLSSRQFQNPELIGTIDSILKKTGMPADYLDIEISESTVMSNVDRSAARMRELAGMGIHISIDDFGTGYSSLNYLKRLPIEKLKIDRSFIQDIAANRDDRAIVTAVTLMAHTMNLKVVAEGVENAEQLEFLRTVNCDEAQGFLFSSPLPVEEFTRHLVETK